MLIKVLRDRFERILCISEEFQIYLDNSAGDWQDTSNFSEDVPMNLANNNWQGLDRYLLCFPLGTSQCFNFMIIAKTLISFGKVMYIGCAPINYTWVLISYCQIDIKNLVRNCVKVK